MMEKDFLGKRFAVCVALFAWAAGASGVLSAAEVRGIRISSNDSGTRVVLDLSEPARFKTFQLDAPRRVVIDLSHSAIKSRLPMPAPEGAVTGVRAGKQPNKGVRLVFEVRGPV